MPKHILLATTNRTKESKLRWALQGLDLDLVTPAEAKLAVDVEENGATHRANAVSKAEAWSRAYGGIAIATDGGAIIPALGDRWNSLRTRRFAGEDADDRARVEALLRLMALYEGDARRVFWHEAVAAAENGRVLEAWEAEGGQGVIARDFDPRRVNPGFWVATVWLYPSLGKRYVECTEEELARAGDPWVALRERLQAYFRQA